MSVSALNAVHRVDSRDHVATALRDLDAGQTIEVDGRDVTLRGAIPQGHKVALMALSPGDRILKYGWPIGVATQAIAPRRARPHP